MSKKKKKTKYNYSDSNVSGKTTAVKTVTRFTPKPLYYTYKGKENQTEFPEFVELCKLTQEELIKILPQKLIEVGYTDVVIADGYIYAKGTVPVLLTAHMDTVHRETVKDFYEHVNEKGNHVIASPQGIGGDDRCGIYMILQIIKEHKCSVLFCEDEESGGIGSEKFCKTEFINELADLKYLIELDRANGNDAVFYDCDNYEFIKFIEENTGYKEAWGSFSDISTLAPACGVAAVNLSCGYYHAHTLGEEVVVEEMFNTIEVVKKLLTVECGQFEYIEALPFSGFGGYNRNSFGYKNYDRYWDWDDDDDYARDYDPKKTTLWVQYYSGREEKQTVAFGASVKEAWYNFFMDNPDSCFNDVIDYDYF